MTEGADIRRWTSSNPWSEEQKKRLEAYKLNTEVYMNFFKPTLDALTGVMMSNNNKVITMPDNSRPARAYLWQPIMQRLFDDSSWPLIYPRILADQFSSGIGWAYVTPEDPLMRSILGTRIRYMDYLNVRWPLAVREPLFEDANHLVQFDVVTIKQAIMMSGEPYDPNMLNGWKDCLTFFEEGYGKGLEHLGNFKENSERMEESVIPMINVFTKENKRYWELITFDEDKNRIESSELIPRSNEEDEDPESDMMSHYFSESDSYDERRIKVEKIKGFMNSQERINPSLRVRVVQSQSVGGHSVGRYELPTSDYPLVPFVYDMFEQGRPCGVLKHIRGINMTFNETLQLMMLIGRFSATPRVFVNTGSLRNRDAFLDQMQGYNPVIEVDMQVDSEGKPMPLQVVPPTPLSPYFTELMRMCMMMVDFVTSVTDAVRGSFEGAAQPANSAINTMLASSQQRFNPKALANQYSIIKAAKVAVGMIKKFSDSDKVIYILEDDNTITELLAEESDDDSFKDVAESKKEVIGRKVNTPRFNAQIPVNYRVQTGKGKDTVINNLRDTDEEVDFRMEAVPATDNVRQNWINSFNTMLNQWPEATKAFAQDLFQLMNYPHAHKLSKKLNEFYDQKQIISDMGSKLDDLKRKLMAALGQLVRTKAAAGYAVLTAEAKADFDKIKNNFQLKLDAMNQGMTGNFEQDVMDLAELSDQMDEMLDTAKGAVSETSVTGDTTAV